MIVLASPGLSQIVRVCGGFAIPTLVEVKRASDTRVRREVVGQMLDYAANGQRYWPAEQLRVRFDASIQGKNPDLVIQEFAGLDANEFWDLVTGHLREGRVRLLFISDQIPAELQTAIEYLNEQMESAEVLGVAISRYAGGGLSVLVPRVVGTTIRAHQAKRSGGGPDYGEQLEEAGDSAKQVEMKLLQLANERGLPTRRTSKALQCETSRGTAMSRISTRATGCSWHWIQ